MRLHKLGSMVLAVAVVCCAVVAQADTITHGSTTINMDFVTVGNAGNAADDTGYGAVGYNYRIGTYEVTAAQWAAVIAADSSVGNAGYWSGSQPTAGTSWYEAAKFCNWLTTGNVNSGVYNTSTWAITDHQTAGATYGTAYFIPTENEWYKASYYDPAKSGGPGYWDYPTRSDTVPTAVYSGTAAGTVVCTGNDVFPSGPAYVNNAGGLSAYGTMGQGGNVGEWHESIYRPDHGTDRGIRGGAYGDSSVYTLVSERSGAYLSFQHRHIGFRVASTYTPFTPPAQTRPTTPSAPAAPPGEKGLIVLVHGMDSTPAAWANEMKADIDTKLTALGQTGNWAVMALDWSDAATVMPLMPNLTAIAATEVGKGIGKAIQEAGYNKVHFVAHSNGAWLANGATEKIKDLDPSTEIQCTFLDPFVTNADFGVSRLGKDANWAENYISTGDLPGTNSVLVNAHNFDITAIAAVDGDPNTTAGHSWPYKWYDQTVKSYDPASKTGWVMGYNYGYKLAMEMNGGTFPNITDPALGAIKFLPPGTISNETLPLTVRHDTILDFQNLAVYQSDSGTRTITGTQLGMTTGSPVWMTSLLTVSDPVNFLTFQADFTSQPGAEGLLAVYWAGEIIGMIDERYALEDMQDYTFALAGTSDPGTYELSFRLDPYTDTASSVLIDNVATGFVVPEPSTLSLLAMAALCLVGYVRRRKRA